MVDVTRLEPLVVPLLALVGVVVIVAACAGGAGAQPSTTRRGLATHQRAPARAMARLPQRRALERQQRPGRGIWALLSPGVGGAGAGALPEAHWARRRELRPLIVPAPVPGRLTVGTSGRRLIAAEAGQSLLVVGPTQSHKTSGLAIPAILEWDGPVLAASVKADLAHATIGWRRQLGTVWLFDPTGCSGLEADRWSPLARCGTWASARRVASELVAAARSDAGSMADGDFWYATAAKLLAPLLLAAAVSDRTMADVVRWLDEQQESEVACALTAAGEESALRAAAATWQRDPRQRSAVYTTAETVLDAYCDPGVAASADTPAAGQLFSARRPGVGAAGGASGIIDPNVLLSGRHTVHLCAPSHDQRRLRPVFTALVNHVLHVAYERAGAGGTPLDPPLLVVIDEAANVAPLAELDSLASTAAGHGIQLLTVWQDLAQLTDRYGTRAQSILNNHRAKLFLSGIADHTTLEQVSALIGDVDRPLTSFTRDARQGASTTTTSSPRRLLAPDGLRRLPPGSGVLISGHLAPISLRLRPWFHHRELRRRAMAGAPLDRPAAQ